MDVMAISIMMISLGIPIILKIPSSGNIIMHVDFINIFILGGILLVMISVILDFLRLESSLINSSRTAMSHCRLMISVMLILSSFSTTSC